MGGRYVYMCPMLNVKLVLNEYYVILWFIFTLKHNIAAVLVFQHMQHQNLFTPDRDGFSCIQASEP